MQNYSQIYESSKKELEKLKVKKEVLVSQITELTKRLNLTDDDDLEQNLLKLKNSTTESLKSTEEQIKSLISELKADGFSTI